MNTKKLIYRPPLMCCIRRYNKLTKSKRMQIIARMRLGLDSFRSLKINKPFTYYRFHQLKAENHCYKAFIWQLVAKAELEA